MLMMKKNKVMRTVGKLFLGIVAIVLILLIVSSYWLERVYGDISFSTVIYQLLSPLKGTNADTVYRYIKENISRSILIGIGLLIIFLAQKEILNTLEIKITVYRLEYTGIYVFKKWIIPLIIMICLICISSIRMKKIGVFDFLRDLRIQTKIYEDNYVSPDEIKIKFPEKKNNLVVIYVESMESTFASKDTGGLKDINYIPELTELALNNVNFSKSDKLGGAIQCNGADMTISAIVASNTGVNYKLPIEKNTAEQYETIFPGLYSMGEILEKNGYKNYYMCGSDSAFAGKKMFLETHGNYKIWDYYSAIDDKLIDEKYHVHWGFEDEKLFEYAKDKLNKIAAANSPFSFMMLTSDTHEPQGYVCEKCENIYPEQYANVIACTSRQVYEFIEWMKEQYWYNNTTIVILGDHVSMNNTFYDGINYYDRTIYNCFINSIPDITEDRYHNRAFSTMDMFPTILSAMGANIEGDMLGIGTNLFSGKKTLIEEMGFSSFNEEISKNSTWYLNKFVYNGK